MILLHPIKAFSPLNILFSRKAPPDDLVTKIAKVIYQILEYLFHSIERGMEYLMHDPRPKPFHVRYKWSIRVTVLALSFIGMYYGTQYVKERIFRYFTSFIPDFNPMADNGGFSESIGNIKSFFFNRAADVNLNKYSSSHGPVNQDLNFNGGQVETFKEALKEAISSLAKNEPSVVEQSLTNPECDFQFDGKSSAINSQLMRFFSETKNIAVQAVDILTMGKKIIKIGAYDLSYYALDKCEVEKPEKYLNPLGSVLSILIGYVGVIGLFGGFVKGTMGEKVEIQKLNKEIQKLFKEKAAIDKKIKNASDKQLVFGLENKKQRILQLIKTKQDELSENLLKKIEC